MVEEMRDVLTHAVQLDAMDRDALSALGVQDFDVAFGLMDTIEKSAEILIKVMSCGGKKQFITREQILALAEPYNVPIDPAMLD